MDVGPPTRIKVVRDAGWLETPFPDYDHEPEFAQN